MEIVTPYFSIAYRVTHTLEKYGVLLHTRVTPYIGEGHGVLLHIG